MPGVPDSFIQGLDQLPRRFTRGQALAAFDTLRESSVAVYLSQLVHSGHLRRVGLKEFERATPQGAAELDSLGQEILADLRGGLFPSAVSRLVIWSSEALAPFAHDAIVQPFGVVEGPKELVGTIADRLSREWNVLEASGHAGLGELMWKEKTGRRGTDVFIRKSSDLRGTVPSTDGPRVPTLERLFVDVLQLRPSDPGILLTMLRNPSFEFEEAMRVAGSRSETAKVSSFLTWVAMKHPGWRVGEHMRNRFAHLRAEVPA